ACTMNEGERGASRGGWGRILSGAAASVDRAVVAAMQMRNRGVRSRAEGLSHDERMARLAAIRETYGAPELVSEPKNYFVPPLALTPRVRVVRRMPWGAECIEASWESAFQPFATGVRDAYLAHVANRTAHARMYVGGGRRPAAILVHGYMSGQWAIEERAWPIRWLNRKGLDVAVTVLPFHGVRARAEGGAPPFPGADPRFTNEGFRQAVADLRVLIALLRSRGATAVGLMGMSLGGYTTALMATVEDDLAFAVPFIPLSSTADFARDQGRLGTGPRAQAQHTALEAANRVVSPFARPPRIAPERVLVVGAEADRVTPIAHAERVAAHLRSPLLRVQGGHLVQTWRATAFRATATMLRRSGVI
ncbi:MAG: alpha/beta hydrolase family protein, partial [Polyangiaceae bacterium]